MKDDPPTWIANEADSVFESRHAPLVIVSTTEIDIAVEDARWAFVVANLEGFVARAVEAGLAALPDLDGRPREISVLLTTDTTVRDLDRTWRGQDKPTNVLSFPAPPQFEPTAPAAGVTV